MDYELILTTPGDGADAIVNLWRLYQYDLCDCGGMLPNAVGLFENLDVHAEDYSESLNIWWEKPNELFPFLIRTGGRAAGFALIGRGPDFAPDGSDYFVHEFFVLRPFRERGLAESVAVRVFGLFPGKWQLAVLPANARALRFWRRVIPRVASGPPAELLRTATTDDVASVVFRFRADSIDEGRGQ